jgi:hypothetical protein
MPFLPLGLVAFVRGAEIGDFFPFWSLSGLYFLQNWTYVLVVKFSSQIGWVLAGCGYSSNSSYLIDFCPRLDFVYVSTLFSAWSSGKSIDIVVFSALTMLGREVLLFQALKPASGLSLKGFKTHEPVWCGVVDTQVELLSLEVLMEIFWCPHDVK